MCVFWVYVNDGVSSTLLSETKSELISPWDRAVCGTGMERQNGGDVPLAGIGDGTVAPQWMALSVPQPTLSTSRTGVHCLPLDFFPCSLSL